VGLCLNRVVADLVGRDSVEPCSLNDRIRARRSLAPPFMAPTQVQFLQFFPFHEPSLRPRPRLTDSVSRTTTRTIQFMVPMRGSRTVEAFHEPQKVAQASCLFGADRLEACPTLQLAARFMAATHVRFLEVFAFHEPRTVRPLWAGEPSCICEPISATDVVRCGQLFLRIL